jgi:hypothetical protein
MTGEASSILVARGTRTSPVRPALQRKCACGQHAASGECEECQKTKSEHNSSADPLLQRSALNHNAVKGVPKIVHEVLRSPGQPLDASARAFFEPRFGQDLSRVRVHASSQAAESAKAVNALAYTVGNNVVFGPGQFQPETGAGRRLLAHELTHTLQQRGAEDRGALRIGPAGDEFEREAEEAAKRTTRGDVAISSVSDTDRGFLRRQGNPLQKPPTPPRGTNPAACMTPACAQVAKAAPPANDKRASELADQWLSGAKSCVTSGASGSNASHQAEISQHEQDEMDAEAAELKKNWAQRPKRGFSNAEFLKWLGDICKRRQRQVEIEFRYNVIFENPPAGLQWDLAVAYWDPIDNALAALPDTATWSNPRLLKFRREACHPDDVDAATGSCKGRPAGPLQSSFTGGETNVATGEITVFNAGLSSQPYSRSTKLGLSATEQTIRHEVGHVIGSDLPPDKKMEFFEKVVGWIDYPWAWISVQNPPYDNWKAERNKVKAELGLDDRKLDAWLAGLQVDQPVEVGSRTYVRAGNFLRSIPTQNVPPGAEFAYARTNQGEYFAELYALAVSNPEFLHGALPYPQIHWLKTEVFHTTEAIDEVARQAAVGEPQLSEFLERARRLFTVQQMKAALNEVLSKPRARTGTVA